MEIEKRLRVILVDNSRTDYILISTLCADLPYEVDLLHFYDGVELMDYLKNNPNEDVAFILLDLMNPRMNGRGVIPQLRASDRWETTPVIIFSSTKRDKDVEECMKLGANAYIYKSPDISTLEKTMRYTFNFWGFTNVRVEVPRY